MNEIVKRFLLAGDKCMPDMHLRKPRFTQSPCEPCTKNKGRIQKFKEIRDSRYTYQNKLHKVCFGHDMAYENFKDLTRKTASDKILRDKVLILLKIQNMMDIKAIRLQ